MSDDENGVSPDADAIGVATFGDPEPQPDHAWKALSLVNDWIRHAEAKAGAVLAATGVLGGVLYNLVKNRPDPPCHIAIAAFLCGVCILGAGLCAWVVLVPRRRISRGGGTEDFQNLLFYSHIALNYEGDEPSYVQVLSALTSNPTDLTRHIANQVHANSIVAHRKFDWSAEAIKLLIAALLLLALLTVFIGASYAK